MLDAMIVDAPRVKSIEKDYGEVFEATLTVDTSPQRRTALIEVYNRQLVERRLVGLAATLAFILICLAADFRLHSRRRGDQGLLHQSTENAGRRGRRRIGRDHLPHGGLTGPQEKRGAIHVDAGHAANHFRRACVGFRDTSDCSSAWAQVLSRERLRAIGQGLWPLRLTLWQMMCVVAVAAFLILVFEKQLEVAVSLLGSLLSRSGVVRPRMELMSSSSSWGCATTISRAGMTSSSGLFCCLFSHRLPSGFSGLIAWLTGPSPSLNLIPRCPPWKRTRRLLQPVRG